MQLNTGARFVIMYVLYQLQWHKKAMPLLHRPISVTYWTCYILSNINVTLIPSLMGTLKLHSNELYYTTIQVIGTLNVDGWAVTFGTARSVLGRLRPTQSLLGGLAVVSVGFHSRIYTIFVEYPLGSLG